MPLSGALGRFKYVTQSFYDLSLFDNFCLALG